MGVLMAFNRFGDRIPPPLGGAIQSQATRGPLSRSIRRNTSHGGSVDRSEFGGDLRKCSRHPAEVQVAPEKPLVGNACLRLMLLRDLAVFFGLDQLMQSMLP